MVDFLGIGAQKAGTSWLYQNLRRHPQVWFPLAKEAHFFDAVQLGSEVSQAEIMQAVAARLAAVDRWPLPGFLKQRRRDYLRPLLDPQLVLTDEWYRHLFSAAPAGKTKGEITPVYCAIGAAGIAHVKRMSPQVRLIYVVRDPLERSCSSLRMVSERKDATSSRQLAVAERPHFQARGDYRSHIPLWDEAFGERMLYLPFGWIRSDPAKFMRHVEDFLGLSRFSRYPKLAQPVHVTNKIEIAPGAMAALAEAAEPQYAFLRERFGEEFLAATR